MFGQVEKAGATVLFEEVGGRGNNIGVVVTPVRLSSLSDFGTPRFVADKLIQAEKRKVLVFVFVFFFFSSDYFILFYFILFYALKFICALVLGWYSVVVNTIG